MKIAVVCANGNAGKLIVKEALDRNICVSAVVRGQNKSEAKSVINKDLFDLTASDLSGFDAVIDAFGVWAEDKLIQHSTSLKHLCDLLSGSETILIVVGGDRSLYVNKEHDVQVMNGAEFTDMIKPLASNMSKALDELRQRNDVKWTYISPALDFKPQGEKSLKYVLGGEELTFNLKGQSTISYATYAVALVDEILNGNHIKKRICVVEA